jgi:uncharacterized protein
MNNIGTTWNCPWPIMWRREQHMKSVSYQPGDILRETAQEIREILGESLEALTLERIVFGLFYTGVKLSNGAGGSASPR